MSKMSLQIIWITFGKKLQEETKKERTILRS